MAAPNAKRVAVATDFLGQISASGTQAETPAAAALQVNLVSDTAGELRVRPGLKAVTFEEDDD